MHQLNNRSRIRDWNPRVAQAIALAAMILALLQSPVVASPPPAQIAQARALMNKYYAWLNAPWTGDDHSYQRMRTNIEQAVSQGANPFDLLKQRQKDLDKAPGDFQAQFAYYYTAYQAATWPKRPDNTEFSIGVQILSNLSLAIIRVPHPHTYNYIRMAFLCGQYNFEDPNRKAVGIRLVGHDPNDYDVKYYTITSLVPSKSPSDWVLALKYANDLVTNYPKKPSSHAIAGYVHYQSWVRTKNRQEAAESIVQYHQYLQLEPTKPLVQKQTEKIIAQMQNG